MQLGWEAHFHEIVVPAWQDYLAAEQELTDACRAGGEVARQRVGYRALRFGGAATFYLSHFADIVKTDRPPSLPEGARTLHDVRTWLGGHCLMLRTEAPAGDVTLLADVCDALKHSHLTNRADERLVRSRDAVLALGGGFGELGFGEGKFGGTEQVLVLAKNRTRALSSVLQNVVDAWRRALGMPLPEIGAP